jgi:DNA-binding transcriptional LysR family regulator
MARSQRTDHRLKLPQLNALIAVAQAGSMAKAAKHLATSQSVISKAVGDLENTLGVRLFDRKPPGVELTLYGRPLLKRGIAIFDDIRTSVGEIVDALKQPERWPRLSEQIFRVDKSSLCQG